MYSVKACFNLGLVGRLREYKENTLQPQRFCNLVTMQILTGRAPESKVAAIFRVSLTERPLCADPWGDSILKRVPKTLVAVFKEFTLPQGRNIVSLCLTRKEMSPT